MKTLLLALDLAGTFVFALSGAMTAVKHRLDLFGILVLSFAAATFGGIGRDLLIGAVPPAALVNWCYIAVPVLAGITVFFTYSATARLQTPVLILDGAGLALFAVSGALKALTFGLAPIAAIMLGVLTGVGGGIARDILVAEIPTVLRAELYAVAALAGASVVVIGNMLQFPSVPVAAVGGGLCFGLRFMAIRYGWHLPRACESDKSPSMRFCRATELAPGQTQSATRRVWTTIMRRNCMSRKTSAAATSYRGSDKLILGIVLAVVTFWLFAQTTLNIASTMRADLRISENLNNISVSITALFSGIFIVVAGGLADRVGRMKIIYAGLALSILGSLLIAISPAGTAVFLMAGRIIQGLSAACIMPAALALLKAYFDGPARQRAISFWSIGSWGGSGLCSLFGGLVASSLGWRWIFWMSIVVALVSFLLIRGTPESKEAATTNARFDWLGLIALIIAMVALNVVIGQGSSSGWTSPAVLALIAVFVLAAIVFFRVELSRANSFVDLTLFKNKTFAGATLSNFLLNGAAGTLIVALALVQQAAGLSSLQSGLLTVGYLVAILSTIRVGEKLLQKMGARKPMLYGCIITAVGILLTCCTFLFARQYLIVAFIGFTLFGVGLGFYATPSTDAALSNVPQDKGGSASGLYKMASSLGAAFGVAISAAIFSALSNLGSQSTPLSELFLCRTDNVTIRFAAAMGLLFNVALAVIAAIVVIITIPKDDPRAVRTTA